MTPSHIPEHQAFPTDHTGAVLRTIYMAVFIALCAPSLIAITFQETRNAITMNCPAAQAEQPDNPVACNTLERIQSAYASATERFGSIAQGRSLTALTIIILTEAAMVLYDAIIGPMKKRQFEKGMAQGQAQGRTQGRAEGEAKGITLMQDWLKRREQAEAAGLDFNEPMPQPDRNGQ